MLKYLRESLVCTMYTGIKRCNDIFVAFSQELRSLLSYFPGNFDARVLVSVGDLLTYEIVASLR